MFSRAFNLAKQYKNRLPIYLGSALLSYNIYYQQKQKVDCCGIIGCITKKNNAEEFIVRGIKYLENRGYDSVGMATLQQEETNFRVTKVAKKVDFDPVYHVYENGQKLHAGSYMGIGHTRWASTGSVTDKNAHPFVDYTGRVSIVHNGNIINYKELKNDLIKKGVPFTSDTDSEVICQMLGYYLKNNEGSTLFEAVKWCAQQIIGQWGLVCVDKQNRNKIVLSSNGSPILMGFDEDGNVFIASEQVALSDDCITYRKVENMKVEEVDIDDKRNHSEMIPINNEEKSSLYPQKPYTHWFEQEIYDQPNTILRALGNRSRLLQQNTDDCPKLGGLENFENDITKIQNLVILACGSSYYASIFCASYFRRLGFLNSIQIIEGSEFTKYDLPKPKNQNAGIIFVSQSGETSDLNKGLAVAKELGFFTIGVINVVGSKISSAVKCGVYLNCGREVAVAATKSFTSQVVVLLLIACWMSAKKEKKDGTSQNGFMRKGLLSQLSQLNFAVTDLLNCNLFSNQVNLAADLICKNYQQKNLTSIICLGKGPGSAIAKEGALKLKELTYLHAEAFAAGELKHGPLALIDSNNPKTSIVILIILDDEFFDNTFTALQQIQARKALTIVITDCKSKLEEEDNLSQSEEQRLTKSQWLTKQLYKIDCLIEIPKINEEDNVLKLASLLAVFPFQKLTYEICRRLKREVDKPRGLAKCSTIDNAFDRFDFNKEKKDLQKFAEEIDINVQPQ